jgi:hypothetical protein
MTKPKISILLPTRKRTNTLVKSVSSLICNASDSSNLEFVIAYDDDDSESKMFFENVWQPFISQSNATSKIFESPRYGYLRLFKYVNFLGEQASGDWLMFWNDDALMLTENWDTEILKHSGWFGLLRMPCINMNHPFALFPVIPRSWIDYFGKISPVNHSDWWIYHVTHNTDRLKNIPVQVFHDRADVTGNNNDETYHEQSYDSDGKDPTNPEDYVHPDRRQELNDWIKKLKGLENV